jgi:hypothetical protein
MTMSRRGTRVFLATGLALAGLLAFSSGVSSAASAVPYSDPNAVGSIGLCNQAGQQITSGSVTTTPFAWRAVSTQAAPAPYDNAGRTAILVAYQPLQGLPAGDWSGSQMTSSSHYSNPANPMAAATDGDQSLQDIIEAYPPRWDGFLQLRIYLGTVNQQPYTQTYPALNIQVTGDTWQAVGGSTVNCSSGTAESLASVLLPSTTTTTAPTSPGTSPATASATGGQDPSGTSRPSKGTDPSASKGTTGGTALASDASTAAVASGSTGFPLLLTLALAILVALSAATLLVFHRRRLASLNPVSDSQSSSPTITSTKGDSL